MSVRKTLAAAALVTVGFAAASSLTASQAREVRASPSRRDVLDTALRIVPHRSRRGIREAWRWN
jgi:hypothetical protein